MKNQVKISILTDNCAGSQTLAEHGLSFLLEFDGKSILFDTGQSDLFQVNAARKGIDLEKIDLLVLSHGHYDHGNGLVYLSGKGHSLICHPGCFERRFSSRDKRYIGLNRAKDQLEAGFSLTLTREPFRITDRIFFLGEIPRETDFESRTTTFEFEDNSPDFVMDDSAVAMVLPDGLFVVTGCGHAGIVNTLEHARKVTGINEIHGIAGGFHLKARDTRTMETIRYLQENKVKHVHPSHCTGLPALTAFYEVFGVKETLTGDLLEF